MRAVIATMLLWTLAAAAQQMGQNAPSKSSQTPSISVTTQLVVETVVVKDKAGNPIEGLTAKDFIVTENGVPQTVRFCEHQKLPETPSAATTTPSEPEDVTIYHKLAMTRISPDRKSTRLNSSHSQISYAVFCLKQKKKTLKDTKHQPVSLNHATLYAHMESPQPGSADARRGIAQLDPVLTDFRLVRAVMIDISS